MCDQKTTTHINVRHVHLKSDGRMLMDEGTATVRKITTGIWRGVPLMHKSPYLIYK